MSLMRNLQVGIFTPVFAEGFEQLEPIWKRTKDTFDMEQRYHSLRYAAQTTTRFGMGSLNFTV